MSEQQPPEPGVAEARRAIERLARGDPPASAARERLGAVLRRLSCWMLVEGDEERVEGAARNLEALADALGADALRADTRFRTPVATDGEIRANAWGSHPLIGSASPLAPPIRLRVEGDRVLGEVCFDLRFEGNAGWVHGGFVAAGFDIVLVQGAKLSGRAGPTGTLSVRFLAPTPIGAELRYEARFERAEGRKLFAEARLVRCDDGTATAEAQAVVIAAA